MADPDTGMAAAVRDGAPAASDPGLVVRPVPVPLSGGDAAATVVEHSVHTTTLLPANPGRRGALIFNESVERLYVKCGGFASASAFTVCLGPFEVWQVPAGYGGRLTGQWSMLSGLADLGRARITEY
ncbi:hypothetical protein [Methylococcus capsulatus]|uniref:hypothetical protein n=1 Tax=Methylococcus capsulatus TaxID=414 RepID=UPI001E5DE129|nr:hypothetical protein [Methylococcus capsulatus]